MLSSWWPAGVALSIRWLPAQINFLLFPYRGDEQGRRGNQRAARFFSDHKFLCTTPARLREPRSNSCNASGPVEVIHEQTLSGRAFVCDLRTTPGLDVALDSSHLWRRRQRSRAQIQEKKQTQAQEDEKDFGGSPHKAERQAGLTWISRLPGGTKPKPVRRLIAF
jgi:hypothetical protein